MPKVTIYIPDDLASAVRASGVSMSPACQVALQRQVRQARLTESLRAEAQAGAVRLRAARKESLGTAQDRGFTAGFRWACRSATERELRDVRALHARDVLNWRVSAARHPTLAKELATHGYSVRGELTPDAFLVGFVVGAVEALATMQALDDDLE